MNYTNEIVQHKITHTKKYSHNSHLESGKKQLDNLSTHSFFFLALFVILLARSDYSFCLLVCLFACLFVLFVFLSFRKLTHIREHEKLSIFGFRLDDSLFGMVRATLVSYAVVFGQSLFTRGAPPAKH
jgi:hypothetical protein